MDASEDNPFSITQLTELPGRIACLTLDDPSSSANVMTANLQRELLARVMFLEQHAHQYSGLIVTSAKSRIFIAGADIKYIAETGHFSHDQVIAFCETGQQLYQRFAQLPFPTVATIRGACLGGGLEFTLALDWRVAAQEASTLIGLPEVHLGLIPGWAATARVPRLCSIETAMRRIGGGINLSAGEALTVGLVDQLVPESQLQTAAVDWLKQADSSGWVERRQQMAEPATRLLEQAADQTFGQSEVDALAQKVSEELKQQSPDLHQRAPETVVDLIRRSALETMATASRLEAEAMATVYTSPTGQGLVNTFLLNDRAKRSPGHPPRPESPPEFQTIGIVGLGIMGSSIAELLRTGPWKLQLYDRDDQKAMQVAEQFQDASNVEILGSIEDLKAADVVLENVVERLDVKRQVLDELEAVVPAGTHLLTNTSVIPMDQLVSGRRSPERFGGLHFFNPIRETRLAEIARHPDMSSETQWVAHAIAKQIRKLSIFVEDGPGLVVNRLLMAFLNEGQHLLANGYSVPTIDAAATRFGWRLGPFQILDVIGLTTAMDAGRQISRQLPESVDAPPFLLPLIRAGYQGVSNGRGFYQYQDGVRHWDPDVMNRIGHYVTATEESNDETERGLADRLIARLNGAMVGQACEILSRGQVEKAADIDLCTVLALGFPTHQGGLLFWADRYPLPRLIEAMQPNRQAAVTDAMRRHLERNERFYS